MKEIKNEIMKEKEITKETSTNKRTNKEIK